MSKSTKAQSVAAPVSAVNATIAGRGTTYTASNKVGYLRALLLAIQADMNAGVDVAYTSSCANYLDTASGKALENRVGKAEGQANSRRVIRALCSQELALLCQTTVKSRMERAKPDSASSKKLAGLAPDTVIQVIQDGSTSFDSFMNKIVANDKDELHSFAKWFRATDAQSWQTKVTPESLPTQAAETAAAE